MDYRRLIVILILVLFIAYMNRTMREGLNLLVPCPDGQVRIPESNNACDIPGSTAAPSAEPTCPPGSTFGTYTSSFGQPITGEGCADNTTRAFVFAVCPNGYNLLGTKCFGPCPGNNYGNSSTTCRPPPPSSTTTPARAQANSPNLLANVAIPSMNCAVENFSSF